MSKLSPIKITVAIAVLIAILFFFLPSSAIGDITGPTGATGPTGQINGTDETTPVEIPKYVIHTEIDKVKTKKTYVKKFKPWNEPTVPQVHKIIAHEAAKWGASASKLTCRIKGESTFSWSVVNSGGYAGLGQFAEETFRRGMRTIGTRNVRYVYKIRTPIVYDTKTILYSDMTTVTRRVNKRRAKYVYVLKGKIPKHPERTHGWAQVRIMARAIVGLGGVNDSEWEVRC